VTDSIASEDPADKPLPTATAEIALWADPASPVAILALTFP